MKERVYNFSAGPSMLPIEVLEDAAANLTNYKGCGTSVMEMSHRSKEFQQIIDDAEANLRKLMNIPENYKVLFLQGGGTLQFSMVPMNLMTKNKKADYIITGSWGKKAAKEAAKFGDVKIVASSEDKNFSYIPEIRAEDLRQDADYVHICYNETIHGVHFNKIPDTGDIPLVADMSSCILSEEVDVSRFASSGRISLETLLRTVLYILTTRHMRTRVRCITLRHASRYISQVKFSNIFSPWAESEKCTNVMCARLKNCTIILTAVIFIKQP